MERVVLYLLARVLFVDVEVGSMFIACVLFVDVDVGEVECPEGHDHTDWITLDLTVNYSVDQLFKLLFSDNDFMRAFLAETGSTGKLQ